MELMKEIIQWRSIRRYKDEPVPSEKLKAVLEAARRAPSWENYQPWHFVVVTDPEVKILFKELSGGQSFLTKAPVIICACADFRDFSIDKIRERLTELFQSLSGKEPEKDFIDQKFISNPMMTPALLGSEIVLARALEQLSYAVSFMILEAVHQGLGACIVGAFGNKATRQLSQAYDELRVKLDLPDDVHPFTLIPLGIPAEAPPARPRKSLDAICHMERFGERLAD